VKEDIERIRQSDMGFPELVMLEAYKKAPVITVGEQCTQPQECRKCMEICATKVFVIIPDAKLVPHTRYPLIREGFELAAAPEAMRVVAAEPTVCTLCMACVRVCPLQCITIETPSK